jgi:hypothetical protein
VPGRGSGRGARSVQQGREVESVEIHRIGITVTGSLRQRSDGKGQLK